MAEKSTRTIISMSSGKVMISQFAKLMPTKSSRERDPEFALHKLLEFLREEAEKSHALQHAFRDHQRQLLAQICVCAVPLAAEPPLWEAFIANVFWTENPQKAPKVHHRELALKFLLRWHCGKGKAASKRASQFWLALKILGDLGSDPAVWKSAIDDAGGVSGLLKARKAKEQVSETGHNHEAAKSTKAVPARQEAKVMPCKPPKAGKATARQVKRVPTTFLPEEYHWKAEKELPIGPAKKMIMLHAEYVIGPSGVELNIIDWHA